MAEDDIRDVMAEEKARGTRRPRRAKSAEEKRERDRVLRDFLAIPKYEDAVKAAIDLGLQPGTERFEQALSAWRAYGSGGRRSS